MRAACLGALVLPIAAGWGGDLGGRLGGVHGVGLSADNGGILGHKEVPCDPLRKLMLEELQRRNYSQTAARAYLLAVRQFAEYFHRPPDQLGPDHIRRFQCYLLQEKKLSPR